MTLYEMCVVAPKNRLGTEYTPTQPPTSISINRYSDSLYNMLATEIRRVKGESLTTPNKVVHLLSTGFRPSLPNYIPSTMGSLITSCWSMESDMRPSFTEIYQLLMTSVHEDVHRGQLEIPESSLRQMALRRLSTRTPGVYTGSKYDSKLAVQIEI